MPFTRVPALIKLPDPTSALFAVALDSNKVSEPTPVETDTPVNAVVPSYTLVALPVKLTALGVTVKLLFAAT